MALTSEKAKQSSFNKPNIQYCKYCGKECKNLNSLKQHECRCRENPNRKGADNLADYIINNRKGKNKSNCIDIAKQSNAMRMKYENGYVNPNRGKTGTFKGKHHSQETKQRISSSVSASRKRGYANGTIVPAKGVGRGKYSYIIYKNNKYMMRSTYEFIYALYLISENIEFAYESIRVPALRENNYSSTFISDFSIGKRVIEIKGIKSSKDIYERESFEAAGYEFEELFYSDIDNIKVLLKMRGFDVEGLIKNIVDGHNSKQYFIYNADK